MYEGIRTYENGRKEEATFDTYEDMVKWLAEDPDAGITAYENGDAVPQRMLCQDIQDTCDRS